MLRGRWTFVLRAGRGAAAHAGGAGMAAAACGAAKCEACILCVVSGYSCRIPETAESEQRECVRLQRQQRASSQVSRASCATYAAPAQRRHARLLTLVSARAAGRAVLRGPSWSGLHLQAASKSNAPERRFRAARRDDLETKGLGARLQKQISASGGEAGPDQIVDLSAFRGGAAKEASCF